MFAYSQKDPSIDPILVWFNGGPGCSSLIAFLQEHGPYVMEDETDFFHPNSYSWNKEANILYIESPIGVGFSYCDPSSDDCKLDDYSSGKDNLIAMRRFFQKSPEFAENDLYITGESFAGLYVPHLVW